MSELLRRNADRDFLIVGYASDTRATMAQGVQGSGIDRVQIWLDIPPEAIQLENAELGFSDPSAATFGTQFANSGFRLLIHPDGHRSELGHDARIYTLTELGGLLARSALDIVAVHGGLDGSPLRLDSRRLVVIAQKTAAGQGC